MTTITDTDRINAIANGLCIAQSFEYGPYGVTEIWTCVYGINKQTFGLSLRETIDKAILAEESLKGVTR